MTVDVQAERLREPPKPDYDRLQAEIERGAYPFDAGDEGELFARAVWLEALLAGQAEQIERLTADRDGWKRHAATSDREVGNLRTGFEAVREALGLDPMEPTLLWRDGAMSIMRRANEIADAGHSIADERDAAVRQRDNLRDALAAIAMNAEGWHGPIPEGENDPGAGQCRALAVIARWARNPASIPAGVVAAAKDEDLGEREALRAAAVGEYERREKSRDEWEREYDDAVQCRDWQTCDQLLAEREGLSWWPVGEETQQ